jgi:flagellar biogenesis protein FliO
MHKKIVPIIILFFLVFNSAYGAVAKTVTPKPVTVNAAVSGYLTAELNNIENPGLPKAPSISGTILRLFLSLLGILGLIYLLAVAGKMLYVRASIPLKSEGVLKILAREYIDTQKIVYFVETADRVLIIGSAGNNLNTLAEITDKDTIDKLKLQADEYIAKYRMKSETKFSDELKAGYVKQGKKLVDAGNQAVKNIMEKFGKKP